MMAVTYLITFRVKPERRDEFLELLRDVLDRMKHESTYREAILHRYPHSENTFMLIETWDSHDDVITTQINRPYRRAWHDALPHILQSEREITVWEPIKADRRSP